MTTYPTRAGVDSADGLFDEPARRITISTTVAHRGRQLVITSCGYTADELCDLLDKRFGACERPGQVSDTATVPPSCPVHRKVMKLMKFADKTGHTHMCTFRYDDGSYCDERA